MQQVEAAAIESGARNALSLMERAAAAAAEEIGSRFGEDAAVRRKAAVLCGPGNNGGDGYAVASILSGQGWQVSVFALGDPGRLSPQAGEMRTRWEAIGTVGSIEEFTASERHGSSAVVDALFGTGLARPLGGAASKALRAGMTRGPVIAIDILSGLQSDTGEFLCSEEFSPTPAAVTVAFECAKPGHFLREGGVLSGEIAVRGIGIGDEVSRLAERQKLSRWYGPGDIPLDRLIKQNPAQHKYDQGHALVLSGGCGKGGAARLAARSALRIGAGVVTVGVESSGLAEHSAKLDSVMLRAIDSPEALSELLADRRITCVCAGPGLGTGKREKRLVKALLKSGCRLVLDADALTIFAGSPAELFGSILGETVLTPHAGEFRRLFPDLHDRMVCGGAGNSKLDAALEAAARANATILLKGHDTVIAAPGGHAVLVPATGKDAAPWLATAGSGDVLAGLAAGLMARNWQGFEAACAAAWLNCEAARQFGPGLISEDLPESMPAVMAQLSRAAYRQGGQHG